MNEEKTVRIGCVGLGGRGMGQMDELLSVRTAAGGVVVPAVCDIYEDRASEAAMLVEKKTGVRPNVYLDYKEMLSQEKLDAVLCCTTWITHGRIAVDCMRAGCDVAIEVGGAASVEECWQMVRVSEETGRFCMLLENCCYDRKEMALFNMARQGIFGEIVHCEGGYRHDLRHEIAYGKENRHGRLMNFVGRNGELYPTHQLGPIAKLLRINRGNRFLAVNSVASKARGLHEFILKEKGPGDYLANQVFNQGDVVTTLITCANGETIRLTHDCTLPRPYSRDYCIQGTKGIFQEAPFGGAIHLDGVTPHTGWMGDWEHFEDYIERYEHPLWKAYMDQGVHFGGHGGMDFLVLSAFVDAVQKQIPPPIDVYDTAAWISITCLSEQSAAMGGAPVPVPDFTNGMWIEREEFQKGIWCLEEVCT